MSEFKGTKGPWVYDRDQEGVFSKNGHIIADIFPGDQEANGLLISKSPEMLEMLIECRKLAKFKGVSDIFEEIDKLIKSATEVKEDK